MSPVDRINLSEAPRCFVQRAIYLKSDPKLHMPAAACKGLRQTMSNTMALAVPLAVRLSCQRCKKAPSPAQAKGLALGRIHIEQKLCLEALHVFSLSVTSLFIWQKKPHPAPDAPVRPLRPEQWQPPACSSWGSCEAEAGCHVFLFFLRDFNPTRNELLYVWTDSPIVWATSRTTARSGRESNYMSDKENIFRK